MHTRAKLKKNAVFILSSLCRCWCRAFNSVQVTAVITRQNQSRFLLSGIGNRQRRHYCRKFYHTAEVINSLSSNTRFGVTTLVRLRQSYEIITVLQPIHSDVRRVTLSVVFKGPRVRTAGNPFHAGIQKLRQIRRLAFLLKRLLIHFGNSGEIILEAYSF